MYYKTNPKKEKKLYKYKPKIQNHSNKPLLEVEYLLNICF